MKLAERYLIQGLRLDPNYTVIRLDLARVYLKQGRKSEARAQLQLVLKTTKPTYPADFYLEDKPAAEKLLKQLESEN
uniref:Tetratricopeptide repeat protein n=1 Tax=candidate division WOR-3 bacterium TaxID=2052148 RepID=A0A7V3PTD7_UNCW3